ncbi:MAG TPA: hypothetical protein VJ809_16320 [Pirellulales bacterium]|nr:hypothetical protein [Pirellulales bacterium]
MSRLDKPATPDYQKGIDRRRLVVVGSGGIAAVRGDEGVNMLLAAQGLRFARELDEMRRRTCWLRMSTGDDIDEDDEDEDLPDDGQTFEPDDEFDEEDFDDDFDEDFEEDFEELDLPDDHDNLEEADNGAEEND